MNTVGLIESHDGVLNYGDIVIYDDMVCICCDLGDGCALLDLSDGTPAMIYEGDDAYGRVFVEIKKDESARIIGPCKITLTPEVEK